MMMKLPKRVSIWQSIKFSRNFRRLVGFYQPYKTYKAFKPLHLYVLYACMVQSMNLCILLFVLNLKLDRAFRVKVGHKEHNAPRRAQRTDVFYAKNTLRVL